MALTIQEARNNPAPFSTQLSIIKYYFIFSPSHTSTCRVLHQFSLSTFFLRFLFSYYYNFLDFIPLQLNINPCMSHSVEPAHSYLSSAIENDDVLRANNYHTILNFDNYFCSSVMTGFYFHQSYIFFICIYK